MLRAVKYMSVILSFLWCFPEELSGEEADAGLSRQIYNSRRTSDGLRMI